MGASGAHAAIFERCSDEVCSKLEELEFPCPDEVRSHSNKISLHASIKTSFTAQARHAMKFGLSFFMPWNKLELPHRKFVWKNELRTRR